MLFCWCTRVSKEGVVDQVLNVVLDASEVVSLSTVVDSISCRDG